MYKWKVDETLVRPYRTLVFTSKMVILVPPVAHSLETSKSISCTSYPAFSTNEHLNFTFSSDRNKSWGSGRWKWWHLWMSWGMNRSSPGGKQPFWSHGKFLAAKFCLTLSEIVFGCIKPELLPIIMGLWSVFYQV